MADHPHLTESDVRSLVDQKIFQRGKNYYKEGYLSHLKRQGNKIWGQCAGNELYDLSLTLQDHDVVEDHCSCPYD